MKETNRCRYPNLISALLLTVFFAACSTTNDEPEVALQITTMMPLMGPYSTIVTLTGSGFSPNATENEVMFNGKAALVQTATATQLKVEVPKAAGTGVVTVKRGSKTASGPSFDFIYTYSVSTLAGSTSGYAEGPAAVAKFSDPAGLALDGLGNLYIADRKNNRVRKLTPGGMVSTLAGGGVAGFADGVGSSAQFKYPSGIATDAQGNLYVADSDNSRIRKISSVGVVTTLAGTGVTGFADGLGSQAKFSYPYGIAADNLGNLYVGDGGPGANRVRKITPDGVVTTLAGSATKGKADGVGGDAQFYGPGGVVVDNDGNVYVADITNGRIRKVTPTGVVSTVAGSTWGMVDGPANEAQFRNPVSVAVDGAGNLYVADRDNHRIRKISAGVVTTVAGGENGFADGAGAAARFWWPEGIILDGQGNLLVADTHNGRIRKITIE